MESQRLVVERVDRESDRLIEENERGSGSYSRFVMVLRLLFLPMLALFRPVSPKPEAGWGAVGRLRESVNSWALRFVTEAKRYERLYGSDRLLKRELDRGREER